MFFNDTFIQDSFFVDFGMTNSIYLSNIIGSGAQFDAKLYRLDSQDAFRTSSEASSRITKGATVVLKRPKLSSLLANSVKKCTKSAEKDAIDGIVQEWRVISHPGIREHKNILDVYGFAWEDEEATNNSSIAVWPVIIVEYAKLGTLDQFLASSGVLNWETKLRLASGISHGVAALHNCGIVHSDLKPENILVCKDKDNQPVPKLSDFGLSSFLNERDVSKKWETGTDGWMSPEWKSICTNEQITKADIYSCGLILWTILLDGLPPWKVQGFQWNNTTSFDNAKASPNYMIEAATQSTTAHGGYSETQTEQVSRLFRSLLCEWESRTLDGLLAFAAIAASDAQTMPEVALVHNDDKDDRPIFADFDVLQELPEKVQRQLVLSLSEVVSSDERSIAWRGEAAYALAITELLCIGTVRLINESSEYTGYTINSYEVRRWLRHAAELGSPSAQAIFYPITQALIALDSETKSGSESDNGRWPDVSIATSWLRRATCLGSPIASKWLRELDFSAWQDARNIFKSKYYGIGRDLFENISIDTLVGTPVYNEIGGAGDCLLHLAASQGRIDIVKTLISERLSPLVNKLNRRGETALLQACRGGHYEIAIFLISVGANAGICSNNGENTLHWLCSFDVPEVDLRELASLMIEAGADLEKVCSENMLYNPHFRHAAGPGTPLCRMVQQHAFAAAKVLTDLGANPYNFENNFAMRIAVSSHSPAFIKLFLDSNHKIRLPKWQTSTGLLSHPKRLWEVISAIISNAPTIQSAAPSVWRFFQERGFEDSLLGFMHPFHKVTEVPELYAFQLECRPIFDILLQHAGPNTEVDIRRISENRFVRLILGLVKPFHGLLTITTFRVSNAFVNLIHQISAVSPDPYFLESVLKELPPAQAKDLVNSHGHFDELPLTMAIMRGFYRVAEVLLKYGANIEEEGYYSTEANGLSMTPLGAIIMLNNQSSTAAVSWLLNRKASFITNKSLGVTAFAMAIRSGSMFEMDPPSSILPIRLYRRDNTVLELLVNHFVEDDPAILDYLPENGAGITALCLAVWRLNPGAVNILLKAGSNPKLGFQAPNTEPISSIDFARSLNVNDIPPQAQARGPEEVQKYLSRFEEIRQVFTDY
ncbi:serine threonine kinase [Fusarium longipes]|uniref:Serine threonine kinase n=1 Tax=Fusarium longipes TaxID=694270 RepID=A0A395TA08_9HYPO|nr:serine threonine kinase [Fusarium longipes]